MTITKTSSYKIISCPKCFWLIPGTSKPIGTCGNIKQLHGCRTFQQTQWNQSSHNHNHPWSMSLTYQSSNPCSLCSPCQSYSPCSICCPWQSYSPFYIRCPCHSSCRCSLTVPATTAPAGTMFTLKSLIPKSSTPETILQSPMLLQIELFLIPDT